MEYNRKFTSWHKGLACNKNTKTNLWRETGVFKYRYGIIGDCSKS